MLYEATDPQQYLDELEDDWRKALIVQIRALILHIAPDLHEQISYKMLGYGLNDDSENVFHLNAQKQHVGLYVGNISKIDPSGALLIGLNVGKGCIRFKKSNLLADVQLEKFITSAVSMWREGKDISC